MDIENLLNLERRTGIKNDDIEDFARKADDVQRAIEGMMRGELRPEDVKIAGIESEEEKTQKEEEKRKRLALQKIKDEELRLLRKNEEKERWWLGADLFVENKNTEKSSDVVDKDGNIIDINEKIKLRYTADYSRWNEWKPNDPASLLEEEEKKKLEDDARNKEFEKNNPDFCNQYLDDMRKRSEDIAKKRESADSARLKGNNYFKKKLYDDALSYYIESLKLSPYDVKTLTNMAQVYIQKEEYDDALEYLTRTLYLDKTHIKALSRKAYILRTQDKPHQALEVIKSALELSPNNDEILAQNHELELIIKDIEIENELKNTARTNSALNDGIKSIDHYNTYIDELANSSIDYWNNNYHHDVTSMKNTIQKLQAIMKLMVDVNIKCYVRISGLLLKLVHVLNKLYKSQEPCEFIKHPIFVDLFKFFSVAIDSQRAAQLVLFNNNIVTIVKSLFNSYIIKEVVYLEAMNCLTDFMKVFCLEETCSTLRDSTLLDKAFIGRLAVIIGELSGSAEGNDATVSNLSYNLIMNLSSLIQESTICDKKKELFGNEMSFVVCAIGTALQYWIYAKISQQKLIFVEHLVHALIGLSQYEELRQSFTIPFLQDNDNYCCVNIILECAGLYVDVESKVYAILMNITIESTKYDANLVKSIIISSYFDELMNIVLMSDGARSSCPDKLIISRGTGLISRIISVVEIQDVICNNVTTMYKGLCSNLKRLSKDILEKWEIDEQSYLIKILASINPSNDCMIVALNENILESIMNLFPMPRLELNQITRNSIILPPSKVSSSILLGNACKILINYSENVILYESNLLCIEKLICCLANVHDIRVRKNIAIILAKGSKKIPHIKEKIQDLRGLEMLTELNDKL